MKKEIKILGAGPAGLVAGINLAKAGYKVTIFEKNKTCGKRFNGDLQGLENWTEEKDILEDLKSMNIKINFHCNPFYKLKARGPNQKEVIFNSEKPIFYLVKRGDLKNSLDKGLMKQAVEAGVNIKFNTIAKEEDCDIICKGPTTADAIAGGIVFNTRAKDMAIGILDNSIAPKGYAYLLISEGRGCIVTVLFRHFKNEKEYLKRTFERFNNIIKIKKSEIREFSGYGNCFLVKNYNYNNKKHVGEGIGLQDCLWGFGMRYAMTSGYLAAKSIINNEDYDKLLKERFESQLKTSISNRYIFEKMQNWGYNLFLKFCNKNKDPVKFLNKYYNKSFLKTLIFPIAKYKMKSNVNQHKECGCTWCQSKEQRYN